MKITDKRFWEITGLCLSVASALICLASLLYSTWVNGYVHGVHEAMREREAVHARPQ